jgi:hypothetical protein
MCNGVMLDTIARHGPIFWSKTSSEPGSSAARSFVQNESTMQTRSDRHSAREGAGARSTAIGDFPIGPVVIGIGGRD